MALGCLSERGCVSTAELSVTGLPDPRAQGLVLTRVLLCAEPASVPRFVLHQLLLKITYVH